MHVDYLARGPVKRGGVSGSTVVVGRRRQTGSRTAAPLGVEWEIAEGGTTRSQRTSKGKSVVRKKGVVPPAREGEKAVGRGRKGPPVLRRVWGRWSS